VLVQVDDEVGGPPARGLFSSLDFVGVGRQSRRRGERPEGRAGC
jgi:hypothetical protein